MEKRSCPLIMNSKSYYYIMGQACVCPVGYTENSMGVCESIDIQPPTITHSDYCLAPSKRVEYTNAKTRIYKIGFDNNSIELSSAPSTDVEAEMSGADQWRNLFQSIFDASTGVNVSTNQITVPSHEFVSGLVVQYTSSGGVAPGGLVPLSFYYVNVIDSSHVTLVDYITSTPVDITSVGSGSNHKLMPWSGPMNRAGVWIDSDCNGSKDPLTTGQQLTLAYNYNNTGGDRTIYVGIGADNQFTLKVNGNVVANTTQPLNTLNFNIWHIFPVTIIQGWNYFNAVAIGDGSVNDSIGMTVYDNTPSQLVAATSDSGLNILFSSQSLISQHIDVASCPSGYNLDTSGGQGNYHCIRTLTTDCL
jgi:hypothetical protein